MNETNLIQVARQKLLELGYKNSDIYTEFLFNDRNRIDIVVFSEEKPYLIVEVKTHINFNNNLEYKFDPAVRQAQTYANTLTAPFFSVYNGKEFYWFVTDSNGRPELLRTLKAPSSDNNSKTHNEIKKSLLDLRSYVSHSLRSWTPDQLLILLYVQILDEMGYGSSKKEFLNGKSDDYDLLYPFDYTSYDERENLHEVFYKLERIKYLEVNPEELLLVLDEVFFSSRNSLFVPRWLSDLMVILGDIQKGNSCLDFFTNRGNFIASILYNKPEIDSNTIKAVYTNNTNEYWLRIQELLLCRKELKHIRINPLQASSKRLINENTDRIFMAPILGEKSLYVSDYTGEVLNDNLEILIEESLKQLNSYGIFISIIPDSFLFANKYKSIRNILKKEGSIVSLISLPSETFKPYSQLKTSILIYEKGNPTKKQLFVAKINKVPERDTFNSADILSIKIISDNFLNWLYDGDNYNIDYIIPNEEVDYDNLISLYNRNIEAVGFSDSKYNMIPLVKLCKEIKKGSNVRIDKNGNIPFINPASIRELFIDESKLGLTATNHFQNNSPRVHKGDIVINSISTYRGAAALIGEDFNGLLVNNQVIIIRPINEKILPEYLNIIFNSKYIQDQIKMISSGAVISFIPLSLLRELRIPVPPIEVQKNIINSIEQAKIKVIETENSYRKAYNNLAELLRNFNVEEGRL